MTVRVIVVLILIALGAVVWQKQQAAKSYDDQQAKADSVTDHTDQEPGYFSHDVEGVEPDVPPDIHVDVELTKEGPRNVLNFTITEKHGWYVDHVYVEFWHVKIDKNGDEEQVGDSVRYLCHNYLDFGATLVENTTLLDLEFPEIDDFGISKNWRASVPSWGKVLAPK